MTRYGAIVKAELDLGDTILFRSTSGQEASWVTFGQVLIHCQSRLNIVGIKWRINIPT